MRIELFHARGCPACAHARAELRTAAQEVVKDLDWREVDVIENLDRAVDLGVLTLPAVVIDGELVFASLPSVAQLRKALVQRKEGRA
jgi:protein-disulfide isomerase